MPCVELHPVANKMMAQTADFKQGFFILLTSQTNMILRRFVDMNMLLRTPFQFLGTGTVGSLHRKSVPLVQPPAPQDRQVVPRIAWSLEQCRGFEY